MYFDRAGRLVPFYTHHAQTISRAAAVGHGVVLGKVADDVCARARARAEMHNLARVAAYVPGAALVPVQAPGAPGLAPAPAPIVCVDA